MHIQSTLVTTLPCIRTTPYQWGDAMWGQVGWVKTASKSMDHEGAGPLHDIKCAPGEALSQLAVVFWEVGHCHAALPVEGLQVVNQKQRAHTSCLACTKPTSHITCRSHAEPHAECYMHHRIHEKSHILQQAHNPCYTHHHRRTKPNTTHQTHIPRYTHHHRHCKPNTTHQAHNPCYTHHHRHHTPHKTHQTNVKCHTYQHIHYMQHTSIVVSIIMHTNYNKHCMI